LSNPTPYDPTYSYTGFSVGQGDNSFPGPQIDADFAALNITTDQTITALADVRRSDGALVNEIVTLDSLSPEVLGLLSATGAGSATAPIYSTVAGMAAVKVTDGITALRVNGYYAPGDGGEALYVRAGVQPSHNGKFQSADGAWWELAEKEPNIRMFGAKADGATDGTGTDASAAVQAGNDYVIAALGGGTLYVPPGLYRISSTVTLGAFVLLQGSNGGHSSGAATTQFIADLALATVFLINGGGAQRAVSLERLSITRQTGAVPASSVGVRITSSGGVTVRDCFILRHAAPVEVNTGATNILLENATFSQFTECGLRWKNGPQLTLIGCSFGQNGGLDLPATAYIEIDGSGGGKIDTLNSIRTQFNTTSLGAGDTDHVGTLLNFKSYTDGDGTFNFVASHVEHMNRNGTGYVITADASTTRIPRIAFDDTCTVNTSATNNNFFNVPATCVFAPFTFKGRTQFIMNLPGNSQNAFEIGGYLERDVSCAGARSLLLGGKIGGGVILSGTINSLVFTADYDGALTDTSTKPTTSSIATRITGASRWLSHAMNINTIGLLTSLAVRSIDHALQIAGTAGSTSGALFSRWSADTGAPLLEFFKSRGAVGTQTTVAASDALSNIVHSGSDGSAGIIGVQEDVIVTSVAAGRVSARKRWQTRNSGGTLAERFAIEDSGTLTLATTVSILAGANSPETVVTANVGSIYLRTNGGAATTLYVKETGTGNTGWIAK
jgi:hypothetical protein